MRTFPTRQLGLFVPVILETGGPTNPVGIAVTLGVGVAYVLSRFLHPGAGRTEADYLTDPATGAQTHTGHAMDLVTAAFWEHPELWNPDFNDATVDALTRIGSDFENYARQFSRAGPGAIATIWYWIHKAITDIRSVREVNNTPTEPSVLNPPDPTLYPNPVDIAYLTTEEPVAGFPWWVLLLGGMVLLRSRRASS